jgi:hypothetical protein
MWVVQTHTEFDDWLNVWGVTGGDNVRRPCMFDTEAEANAEMAEAIKDDPSLELRVVKCKRFTVFATITTEFQKEFWAADKDEAKELGDHEMTVIEPEKGGWGYDDSSFEIWDVVCDDDEEPITSCEEPEAPHTATV